jgi:hypothetical protein
MTVKNGVFFSSFFAAQMNGAEELFPDVIAGLKRLFVAFFSKKNIQDIRLITSA